jgi:hypothetical protein
LIHLQVTSTEGTTECAQHVALLSRWEHHPCDEYSHSSIVGTFGQFSLIAAVSELRAAFVDLSALDRLLSAPSFGPPPDIVPFRHPTFAPDVSGSFTDGIADAIAAHSAAA